MEVQTEIDWERLPPSAQWRAQARAKEKNHARDIDSRFSDWLSRNFEFYGKFVNLAKKAKRSGKERLSADVLAHVVKFLSERRIPEGASGWVNAFTSRLARRAMRDHPELEGMFELRTIRSVGKEV